MKVITTIGIFNRDEPVTFVYHSPEGELFLLIRDYHNRMEDYIFPLLFGAILLFIGLRMLLQKKKQSQ